MKLSKKPKEALIKELITDFGCHFEDLQNTKSLHEATEILVDTLTVRNACLAFEIEDVLSGELDAEEKLELIRVMVNKQLKTE